MNGNHNTPDFEKLNPAKVVPVINDNWFFLGESRVILSYLINQYSNGHQLYPVDARKRANIDRVLYLTAELFQGRWLMGKVFINQKKWPVAGDLIENYVEILKVLEQLKHAKKFLVGDEMSIVDIPLICDIMSVFSVSVKSVAPEIYNWIKLMENNLPEYEELVEKSREGFKAMIGAKVGKKMD